MSRTTTRPDNEHILDRKEHKDFFFSNFKLTDNILIRQGKPLDGKGVTIVHNTADVTIQLTTKNRLIGIFSKFLSFALLQAGCLPRHYGMRNVGRYFSPKPLKEPYSQVPLQQRINFQQGKIFHTVQSGSRERKYQTSVPIEMRKLNGEPVQTRSSILSDVYCAVLCVRTEYVLT
ncbi:hypothetical protein M501DRAFT_1028562 [Patellaria atrata CBS 101060]|uniref:Uncharacterized protein n=1 Tax=Patellaria atrata CBS 101060 TaxID=1346257 RepID=A0A9P4SJL8_9PEZI|nr:hypothetical protein M501DRAFT_1028562 [Patellaria atrata CBS 101060]